MERRWKWSARFLIAATGLASVGSAADSENDLPPFFWRAKPALVAEMKDDRKLVFSAKTTAATKNQPALMEIVSGGYVHVPLAFAWKSLRQYEKLTEVDDHFRKSKYDAETQELDLELEALGYREQMTLHMREEPDEHAVTHRIFFECIKGTLKGMTGLIEATDRGRQTTEISMTARSRSAKLPLPKVLMGLGLELVGQHTAGAIRKFLETEYH